jgi:Transposase
MQQQAKYVALDVHQATLVVSMRDEQGSMVMRATVATEANTIVGLVRGLGTRVHIAFEEGTQAQWLHDVLQPHAERVIVCNTRGRGESGNKSDRVDADRLSELLRLGGLKAVYHGASALLTLKELVRSYVALVEAARGSCGSRRCSRPRDQNARRVRIPAVHAERVVEADRGARRRPAREAVLRTVTHGNRFAATAFGTRAVQLARERKRT